MSKNQRTTATRTGHYLIEDQVIFTMANAGNAEDITAPILTACSSSSSSNSSVATAQSYCASTHRNEQEHVDQGGSGDAVEIGVENFLCKKSRNGLKRKRINEGFIMNAIPKDNFDTERFNESMPQHLFDQTTLHQVQDLRTGLIVEAGHGHYDRRYKERPQRIECMVQALKSSADKLWDRCTILEQTIEEEDSRNGLAQSCYSESLSRVHRLSYLKRLQSWQPRPAKRDRQQKIYGNQLNQQRKQDLSLLSKRLELEAQQYQSIFLTPQSVQAAHRAAFALCELVFHVLKLPQSQASAASTNTKESQPLDNGFALIRPPGHHSGPCSASGYGILNNVAIAAQYALRNEQVQRVAILDWDIHHGDGTQSTFYDNPDVLYISLHAQSLFPFSKDCGPEHVGKKGTNVNVAWSKTSLRRGVGDTEYYVAWESLVLPLIREFNPQLILISCGFDACHGDARALNTCGSDGNDSTRLTPACFGNLIRALKEDAMVSSKIVATLEGGYLPSNLQKCCQHVVRALLEPTPVAETFKFMRDTKGERCDSDEVESQVPNPLALRDIQATIDAHRPYWKSLEGAKLDI